MKKTVYPDIKNSICNWRLPVGSLVLFITALLSAKEQTGRILETGFSEIPGWLAAFCFFADHPNTLMMVAIVTPFVFGADAEEDFKSRFVLFTCSRAGRRKYYLGKILGLILSGGFTVWGMMVLLLLTSCAGFSQITWLNESGQGMLVFYGQFLFYLLCGFFNGALWALLGSFAALVSRSIYTAYAFPFVFYYVLTVFQERYYRSAFILSPRYWGTPFSGLGAGNLVVLLILILAVSTGLVLVLKNRLEKL